jgi:hypothetical protein
MRAWFCVALSGVLVEPAIAGEIKLKVEIPRLNVAEYHRPYVAIWVERPDQSVAASLAVWYDLKLKDNEGTKWLKDLRQWWRRVGRSAELPVDGVTGATRAPGEHQLDFAEGRAPLVALAPGAYVLVVEAAREVGGRELLRVPFSWPASTAQTVKAQGEHELGAVALHIAP